MCAVAAIPMIFAAAAGPAVGAAIGLTGVFGSIVGAALAGAAGGAFASSASGGKAGKGAWMGALGGAIGAGVSSLTTGIFGGGEALGSLGASGSDPTISRGLLSSTPAPVPQEWINPNLLSSNPLSIGTRPMLTAPAFSSSSLAGRLAAVGSQPANSVAQASVSMPDPGMGGGLLGRFKDITGSLGLTGRDLLSGAIEATKPDPRALEQARTEADLELWKAKRSSMYPGIGQTLLNVGQLGYNPLLGR